MQFSTSAALAAIAIFAGQTLADCTAGTTRGTLKPCQRTTDTNGYDWTCPDGSHLNNAGGAIYQVFPGPSTTYFELTCPNSKFTVQQKCTSSPGVFGADCGNGAQAMVNIIQP
ncbi:hypothetical protein E4U43_002742 [Claviceps pusilla]|uniref:Uncharacterized protein n=1 Tax=Claviceps pusilla TaxID=123648 RepID=A0A9P7SY50_9HYPO|nr:hypothetical protein E4U43_002742 [Claviceps pusilla]